MRPLWPRRDRIRIPLRGPVDAADFKTYAFPLFFFKRLSDVHDEEYQTALEESGGDEEYARFPQTTPVIDSLAPSFTSVKWFFVNGSFFSLLPAFLVAVWSLVRGRRG